MNEKLKNLKSFLKKIFKTLSIYLVIFLTILISFFLGFYYKEYSDKHKNVKHEVKKIQKSEVTLAIDENNYLIIIENKTGNYKIFQDSVGLKIFNLYARNIWNDKSE